VTTQLQLTNISYHIISRLDEKDVRLMGPHCPNHPLKVNTVHAV